jgi:hypothetical protein
MAAEAAPARQLLPEKTAKKADAHASFWQLADLLATLCWPQTEGDL